MTNKVRFFYLVGLLAVIATGSFVGYLLGDSPEKNKDSRVYYSRRKGCPAKQVAAGGSSCTKIPVDVRSNSMGNGNPRGIDVPNGSVEKKTEDSTAESIDEVLSEIVSFVSEEAASRQKVVVSALKRAYARKDVRAMMNILRNMAIANKGGRFGATASKAQSLLSSLISASGGLDALSAAWGASGSGAQAAGEGGLAEVADAELASDAQKTMTFEEFEAMIQAKEALKNFQNDLINCGSEGERIDKVKSAMLTLGDESSCNTLAMNLINSSDKPMAARAIAELVTAGDEACQNAAKSAYRWLTGEDWSGSEAAQQWAESYRED